MKKMMVCLLAVSLSSFAMAQKIATVNLEEVILQHPLTEGQKKTLLETKQGYEKIRDSLRDKVKEAEDKLTKVSEKANDAAASEKVREGYRKEAKELFTKYQEARDKLTGKVDELQADLAKQELRFFEVTMEDIRKQLNDIVDARKIDLVLDKSAERLGAPTPIVLYSSDALDITKDLIELCKRAAERNAKAGK